MLVNATVNTIWAAKVTGRKYLFFLLLAGVVNYITGYFGLRAYLLPSLLLTMFAAPVGVFLAFRINSGYGRWWFARRIWGKLVVDSRVWGMYIVSLMSSSGDPTEEEKTLQKTLVFGHIGYINALRLQLRGEAPEEWEKEIWSRKVNSEPLFTPEEIETLKKKPNKATYINTLQAKKVAKHFNYQTDNYNYVYVISQLREIAFWQGQSELIKTTVFPWGYKFYTHILVWLLAFSFILSQINAGQLYHIVLTAFICTAFVTIEQVGRNLDNPFEGQFNDTPMSALCRVIEIDMLNQLDQPCDLKPRLPVGGRLD